MNAILIGHGDLMKKPKKPKEAPVEDAPTQTFTVCLTQNVTRSTVVHVDAKSAHEAEEKAVKAWKADKCQPLEIDDGNIWRDPHASWIEDEEGYPVG